jgi:hypothetical protein
MIHPSHIFFKKNTFFKKIKNVKKHLKKIKIMTQKVPPWGAHNIYIIYIRLLFLIFFNKKREKNNVFLEKFTTKKRALYRTSKENFKEKRVINLLKL